MGGGEHCKGCTVIAFAGTEEKCTWLKKDLGFDHVFNYKCINLDKVLSTVAPGGVDCYFDNVGGDFAATVLEHMNTNGRVCLCGTISNYNIERDSLPKGPYPFGTILFKQLIVQGFVVFSYKHRYPEGRKQMLEWLESGKLKYKETITDGFENMPEAFFGLFKGNNIGKAIVKA